jgi:hypothetical protein
MEKVKELPIQELSIQKLSVKELVEKLNKNSQESEELFNILINFDRSDFFDFYFHNTSTSGDRKYKYGQWWVENKFKA